MYVKGGYTNYGQEIGILMLDTVFPRLQGDIGNACTYEFPVRYKIVKGAEPEKIMGDTPDTSLLRPFIEAANELESEGVKAITTSCGFLTPFQKELAAAVEIPVFTSGLLLVPLVRAMLPPDKDIIIFTERAHHMNERHFNGAGWSSKDLPVKIKGMKEDAVFPTVFIGNNPELNVDVLNVEITEMSKEVIEEYPNIGAIVLECTNMGPFSSLIANTTGVPVFGINNLLELMYFSVRPKQYKEGIL